MNSVVAPGLPPGRQPSPRPLRAAPRRAPRPSSFPSFLAALAMHAALVGWMWIAVQWHTSASAPAVAVLWDLPAPTDTIAAPPPAPPAVNDTTPPPPKEEVTPPPKPDIVEKVEKKQKPEKIAEPHKEPPPKKETKLKPDQPSPQEQRRQQQQAERQHQQEMARLTSQVGVPGPTPSIASAGPLSNAYQDRVRAAVRANIHFAPPEGVDNSVYAAFEVNLIPSTGELLGEPRLIHPSGLPGWDEAVRRAILHTSPFPLPEDGKAPRTLTLHASPNDTR